MFDILLSFLVLNIKIFLHNIISLKHSNQRKCNFADINSISFIQKYYKY